MMVLVALIRTVARMFSIGAFTFLQGSLTFKNWQKLHWFMAVHTAHWGGLELCLGGSPHQIPRG